MSKAAARQIAGPRNDTRFWVPPGQYRAVITGEDALALAHRVLDEMLAANDADLPRSTG